MGSKIWILECAARLLAGSAGTVGDARSKIGGGKISDARFGGILLFQDENMYIFQGCAGSKGEGSGCKTEAGEDEKSQGENPNLSGSDAGSCLQF